ncbi:MAG TPA: protein-L-isoaspartate(D-aspartate) O-methyltransferase [Dehalococcoidia bacterium]|nr:protein-L-isoaspartate(D-aspartate) O-methyltransferase [Dehalococcoidia bacterium]
MSNGWRAYRGSFGAAAAREALVHSLMNQIHDERVLSAISVVPRERFVAPEQQELAYADLPLPIGFDQTISQPRMIAIMLEELHLQGDERVLEIGAGSGYQTALLAQLAREVIGVELIPELAERAANVLRELGYENARIELAGEELGRPEDAPYDAIVVAAAAPRIPQSLIDQLAPGGRLVIPVGGREGQDLLVAEAREEGVTVTRKGGCGFVPLVGRDAYPARSWDAQT